MAAAGCHFVYIGLYIFPIYFWYISYLFSMSISWVFFQKYPFENTLLELLENLYVAKKLVNNSVKDSKMISLRDAVDHHQRQQRRNSHLRRWDLRVSFIVAPRIEEVNVPISEVTGNMNP